MEKNNKNLYNIFTALIMCFFACCGNAFADKIVCEQGKYISKCGDYYVGTNWLKGYTKIKTTVQRTGGQLNTITYTEQTPDYFDYSDNADEKNIANLRIFFNGNVKDVITYTINDNNPANQVQLTESYDKYVEHRDDILNQFCNPLIVSVSCEKCPGNGMVEASDFDTRTNKWTTFKTIADCYMTEYTDSTGTYVNIKNDSQEKCYFVTGIDYVGGSVLGEKAEALQHPRVPSIQNKRKMN